MSFCRGNFWNTEEFHLHIFRVFQNQEHSLHSCTFSDIKYFHMLEIQMLPSLLFRTDFPGYRGLQYVHNFLVFWVISIFFKCEKSQFSRHGLPMNSHANFTYSLGGCQNWSRRFLPNSRFGPDSVQIWSRSGPDRGTWLSRSKNLDSMSGYAVQILDWSRPFWTGPPLKKQKLIWLILIFMSSSYYL